MGVGKIKKQLLTGGKNMQDKVWLKLALFSFIGIVIAVAILAFISPGGAVGSMPMNNMGGSMQQGGGGICMMM